MFKFSLNDTRLLEQAKRQSRVRSKDFGKIKISSTGTKIYHGLGLVPKVISVQPVDFYLVGGSFPTYILDPMPDTSYIYIKSSVDAYFTVYVAGGL